MSSPRNLWKYLWRQCPASREQDWIRLAQGGWPPVVATWYPETAEFKFTVTDRDTTTSALITVPAWAVHSWKYYAAPVTTYLQAEDASAIVTENGDPITTDP